MFKRIVIIDSTHLKSFIAANNDSHNPAAVIYRIIPINTFIPFRLFGPHQKTERTMRETKFIKFRKGGPKENRGRADHSIEKELGA
jgi:hypothetical protein